MADVDRFDPLFFNISPREAEYMDPQERLFLEHSWTALEDAGYCRQGMGGEAWDDLSSRVGVYAGVMYGEYQLWGVGKDADGKVSGFAGNQGGIANRVSYVLNLEGPSMTVDTMCSGSLTGIHLACRDLKEGRTDLAIAGGVNVTLHPGKYQMLSGGQFISTRGRCHSFGEAADGYIPGEGVGVAVLKRLSDAQRDGDHIYGVIRGSALNHGGRTNGYSIPNPRAQQKVIEQALEEARIDPRMISYVEAHGTGTKLGDPIEIAGLTRAFNIIDPERNCLVGSVKSNVGHCESAAGIAGLTKVLLQMQHKQIVPSLHSERLNSHIDFDATPFEVNQELRTWDRPVVDGKKVPRIAGLSSFGAGGSNAHMIIEAYPQGEDNETGAGEEQGPFPHLPHLIVLSAKSEDRLRAYARSLLSFLTPAGQGESRDSWSMGSMADLAYTLQVGRQAMEVRLGCLAGSFKELEEKLKRFLSDNDALSNPEGASSREGEIWCGNAAAAGRDQDLLVSEEDLAVVADTWIEQRAYSKLLAFWVRGGAFDWNRLYGGNRPRRMPLPTYPFAGERYWLPLAEGKMPATASGSGDRLHPLVHCNTSDLWEQRYSSGFTGEEFFLKDHRVQGKRILPGAAYLEMARAAVALGAGRDKSAIIVLKDIVWVRPLSVDMKTEVHVGLCLEEKGGLEFEIYTHAADGRESRVVHSRGEAEFTTFSQEMFLDISGLKKKINQETLDAQGCYAAFKAMGIAYGPGHQSLEEIRTGEGQVLARLSLPTSILESREGYVLHPALVDGAFQAAIGLIPGKDHEKNDHGIGGKPGAWVPFALDKIEIRDRCTESMWVWIRSSGEEGRIQKLDMDLCDKGGRICIGIRGLSSRKLVGREKNSRGTYGTNLLKAVPGVQLRGKEKNSRETHGILICRRHWKEKTVPETAVLPEFSHHLVLVCGALPALPDSALSGSDPAISGSDPAPSDSDPALPDMDNSERLSCICLKSTETELKDRFQDMAIQAFECIKKILGNKSPEPVLVQLVVLADGEDWLYRGLLGLLKTAGLENPKITVQLIAVEAEETGEGLLKKVLENARAPEDGEIRFQRGMRQVLCLEEILPEERGKPGIGPGIWKDRGVYLITGGAGGLGSIFSKEIATEAVDVKLVLTGRSPLSGKIRSQIEELANLGAGVEYQQVDVSQKRAVQELISGIVKHHGRLNGIIHSAGLIRDGFILNKTEEEFRQVLAPKVDGTLRLDLATRDMDLDLFVLFSSGTGVSGNPGQADYATANAFMDAYAEYRSDLVASGKRSGQTLSVNWPFWKEGGMQLDDQTLAFMRDMVGMVPMETREGLDAFYRGLLSGMPQVFVMAGDRGRLRTSLFGEAGEEENPGLDGVSPGAPLSASTGMDEVPSGEIGMTPPLSRATGMDYSLSGEAGADAPPSTHSGQEALEEKTRHYFKKILSATLNCLPTGFRPRSRWKSTASIRSW